MDEEKLFTYTTFVFSGSESGFQGNLDNELEIIQKDFNGKVLDIKFSSNEGQYLALIVWEALEIK